MLEPFLIDIHLHRLTEKGKWLFERYGPDDLPGGVFEGAVFGDVDIPFPCRMEFDYLFDCWTIRINELIAFDFIGFLQEEFQIAYEDACISAYQLFLMPEPCAFDIETTPTLKTICSTRELTDEEFAVRLHNMEQEGIGALLPAKTLADLEEIEKLILEAALPYEPEDMFTIPAMLLHNYFRPGKKKENDCFYSCQQLIEFMNEHSPSVWFLDEKQTAKLLKREEFGVSSGKANGVRGYYLQFVGSHRTVKE